MKTKNPFLSIIVPVYNEEKRLEKGIAEIVRFIDSQKFQTELLVVNDGSKDKTLKLLKNLKHPSFKLISYKKNQGKGFAVKEGMKTARGDWRIFIDIDLSTPMSEFSKFLPHLKKFHVIIGSRKTKNSEILVHQPLLREKLGAVFTWLSSTFLGVGVSDFTCGFKLFSKKAAMEIFSIQDLKGWGFDSEIMFLAQKKGFPIKEIPVKWSNDSQTRVVLLKDIFQSLLELLKIRYNHLIGKYSFKNS